MTPSELRRGVLPRFTFIFLLDIFEGLLLFLAAGTLRWLGAWLFLGASVLLVIANGVYILPRNPEVVVERGKSHKGTRGFDKVVLTVYTEAHVQCCSASAWRPSPMRPLTAGPDDQAEGHHNPKRDQVHRPARR